MIMDIRSSCYSGSHIITLSFENKGESGSDVSSGLGAHADLTHVGIVTGLANPLEQEASESQFWTLEESLVAALIRAVFGVRCTGY